MKIRQRAEYIYEQINERVGDKKGEEENDLGKKSQNEATGVLS